MSLCRCWETSNRLRLRRRLTVVRNSSPGSNILKTNLPSTPSAIRWPITTSLGYGQSSGLQTCAGDGARGLDQVGLQHRLRRKANAVRTFADAVTHARAAHGDRADAGHDLAFRQMSVAHQPCPTVVGQ